MTHKPFSIARAAGHAGLALLVTIVVTAILAATMDVADPEKLGEGVGRFSVFMFAGAFGASYLWQSGKRLAAKLVGGLLAFLLAGIVAIVVLAGTSRPPPAPIVDLVRSADGRFTHPTLGFSLPDPGERFVERHELAQQYLETGRDMRAWVYVDEDAGASVIVMLAMEGAKDERTFNKFFEGVLNGQAAGMKEAAVESKELSRQIAWSDRRARTHQVIADTLHVRHDAFGLKSGDAVVVVSMSIDENEFAGLGDAVVRD